MQRERPARTNEERARALTIGVVIVLLCFTAGLVMSLRGLGVSIGPAPAQGLSQPQTVNGVVTYVQVDGGGHAVACSSTYSSSNCATVGVVLPHTGKSK
jgi:hypothetical protein